MPPGMPLLINAYCTHRAPPPLGFPHELNARRDRSDPELRPHLDGFAGFITKGGERQMTRTLFHVLCHLRRVRHHLSLRVDEAHLGAFAAWGWEANAVLFLPDGTIRDPACATLVDPGGAEPDAAAVVPYPEEARARKAATEAALAARGVKLPPNLPPVVAEVELVLREPAEVAARARALLVVALRGESLAEQDPLTEEALEERLPGACAALTTAERRLFAEEPTKQEVLDATWRYEALQALAWALELVPDLPYPSGACDVPALAKALLAPAEPARPPRLRPASDLLDALDTTYRCHWAVRQAHLDEQEPPGGLSPGVVAERHHALNWLARHEDADWDDVSCPT